jgi:predicted nucleic acid-binding protein
MKQRIYLDTSVFGGVFDQEFAKPSKMLFRQIRNGFFSLVSSAVVQEEIIKAPKEVAEFFEEMLRYVEIVDVGEKSLRLRNAYINAQIVPPKYAGDALHVALATVSVCSIIVSWNFKHIVHFNKIPLYNAVNVLQGYNPILIYSPLEVIEYE